MWRYHQIWARRPHPRTLDSVALSGNVGCYAERTKALSCLNAEYVRGSDRDHPLGDPRLKLRPLAFSPARRVSRGGRVWLPRQQAVAVDHCGGNIDELSVRRACVL